VIRADVHTDPSGRPKGSGIVVFESSEDARAAIQQFNGYDWQGRTLEVREDRYAHTSPGYSGGRGSYSGFGGRGNFGGPGGRSGFSTRGGYGGGFSGRGAYGGGGGVGGGVAAYDAPVASNQPNTFTDYATSNGERSRTIYVRNVSGFVLPNAALRRPRL
jgi:RNA recognition motif-containing protein